MKKQNLPAREPAYKTQMYCVLAHVGQICGHRVFVELEGTQEQREQELEIVVAILREAFSVNNVAEDK